MRTQHILPLSRKLFRNFLISILIPMALVNIIVSVLIGSRQYRDIHSQAENSLHLISAYMAKYLSDIDNITKAPYYHSYFQSKSRAEDLSPLELNEIGEEIGQLLQLTTYSRADFGDLVVMSGENVLYFNSNNWYQYLPTVKPLDSRVWYTQAMEANGRLAITPADRKAQEGEVLDVSNFYISRKLNNLFSKDQENVIMVNLKTSTLETLFSRLTTSAPVMILFTNDMGDLIYSNTAVKPDMAGSLQQETLSFQNKQWKNLTMKLEDYPMEIHVLLSANYIFTQIATLICLSLLCYAAGICVAYWLFCMTKREMEDETNQIRAVLAKVENGDLEARCGSQDIREFYEIGTSVNTMVERLDQKIKNEYQLSIAQKNLQIQALHSQIQPHFIINTIYSFISLNQIGEQDTLNDAFYSFARLLRYVLSKSSETTIEKELHFLEDYLSLHKLRFGSRLAYEILCPEGFKEVIIPKLLLQPLVENAVIHGVEPSEKDCILRVEILKRDQKLYMVIEDNGVGFGPEDLKKQDSIGIRNAETRLEIWDKRNRLYLHRAGDLSVQAIVVPEENLGWKEAENINENPDCGR